MEQIEISRIKENANNPRSISKEKFSKLVKSLLTFPEMLQLRPIVVDNNLMVLGGNMRLRALKHIVSMDLDTLRFTISDGDKFTQGEVDALLKYWEGWRKKPVATIVNATDLTEAQKKEFIIKDNVGFGDWDTNILANAWNTDLLKDWGMEDWQLAGFEEKKEDKLPEELQGVDLTPDDLPDIQGDDETEKQRIIIVYSKEQEDYLAALIGVAKIDKVVYNLDDLKNGDSK